MDRYEHYKDSDFDEIGQIPSHWDVVPMKSIFRFGKGLSITKANLQDEGVPVISYGQIHSKENSGYHLNEALYRFVSSEYLSRGQQSLVNENNFLFADTSEDFEGCGNCVFVDRMVDNLFAGYHAIVARPTRTNYHFRYISFLFLSQAWRTCLRKNVNGVKVFSVTQSILKQQPILLPPFEEQKIIAAYLDSEVSKIDEAIKQQQKMIELLNERRQIIISEAVTKGLNPDVQMKDSGIDWVGEIPKHWEMICLKRVCDIKTGKTPSSNSSKYWDGGEVNWFTPGDFKEFRLTDSERKVTRTAIREHACFEYPACSVYLIGIGGTIGKIAYSDYAASCNQQINVLIPKHNVHYKYIAYAMTICRTEVMRNANMSTLPIINQEKTGSIMITLPPFSEQKAISQQIEIKCASIHEKINRACGKISLLTERKRIIISEAVTGKIKVL